MSEREDPAIHHDLDTPAAWQEANAWLLRLHSGMMSEQEHREFIAWRRRAPLHNAQFQQAERFWDALNGLADQVTRPKPFEYAHAGRADDKPRRATPPFSRPRSWLQWSSGVAATLTLTVLVAMLWPTVDMWLSDYQTHAGEQTSLSLADGSTVHLNTRSALSVRLSDQRRGLSLKRGEALFEVAHDPSRPFEVEVNGRVVRAIGTTFNIDHHDHQTAISVLEGTVRLLHKDEALDIPAGHRVTYETDGQPSAPEPFNPPRITAWHRHEFIFDDMSLDQIIDQLNRYRSGSIVILDSRLRAQRLSGSIALTDLDHSLAMLQHVLPFRITRVTPYLTFISL
jgi:transmembrane sensor